jgi:hypothetical protein
MTKDVIYFEKVQWAAEKNVKSAVVGWNIYKCPLRPFCPWYCFVLRYIC